MYESSIRKTCGVDMDVTRTRGELTCALKGVVWHCGDCGNIYGPDIECCPNRILDKLSILNLVDMGILRDGDPEKREEQEEVDTATPHPHEDCDENYEYGITDDPLVERVADALFRSWFPKFSMSEMRDSNSYNGEYEIAVEDAKTMIGVLRDLAALAGGSEEYSEAQ